MNKGLCADCKYKSYDSTSLCLHPVITEIKNEIQGDDYFISNFTEARVRGEVRKRLSLQFVPGSWATMACTGYTKL
jgi:hypothetical protein